MRPYDVGGCQGSGECMAVNPILVLHNKVGKQGSGRDWQCRECGKACWSLAATCPAKMATFVPGMAVGHPAVFVTVERCRLLQWCIWPPTLEGWIPWGNCIKSCKPSTCSCSFDGVARQRCGQGVNRGVDMGVDGVCGRGVDRGDAAHLMKDCMTGTKPTTKDSDSSTTMNMTLTVTGCARKQAKR